MTNLRLVSLVAIAWLQAAASAYSEPLKLAVFDVDATPAVGMHMAYDPVKRVDELTLRCRGVVLLGSGEPIVLCAVDWIGIANEGHDRFRQALADAVGTNRERVAVHTLHQHDAPGCDFTAERIIREMGLTEYGRFQGDFHRVVIERAVAAAKDAIKSQQTVTHYGFGVARVREVASNRRIMGPDGKVRAQRTTATRDAAIRAEPEGVIDPELSELSFWNGDQPLAVLSFYACHPQSYYRTGIPSSDIPGIARFLRGQAMPGTFHLHFNGAGGNIGAGKYNDGAPANRMVLAQRVADGMQAAFDATERFPLTADMINWRVVPTRLPKAEHLKRDELVTALKSSTDRSLISKAAQLAWVERCEAGHQVDIACLRVGQSRLLFMPGELFVEYQLAAKKLRPDLKVAMAAYGDYGPGYIGTRIAYQEGGYETAPTSSSVAPEVEDVLTSAMKQLLETP